MEIYLRQICLVAKDIKAVTSDLESVFGTPVGHVDPGVGKFGLENILMAFGTQFIEVVSPIQDGTAVERYLDRRGGDGGYMVITQVRDKAEQETVRENASKNDVRVAYDSDRGNWHLMQLHPRDMRAAFFEVEWDDVGDVEGHWNPAGGTDWQNSVNADRVSGITAVELQSADPVALAAHWSAVSGLPVQDRDGVLHIALANADLRFVEATDGRGPGLGAVDVRAVNPKKILAAADQRGARVSDTQVLVCGTRFNLVD